MRAFWSKIRQNWALLLAFAHRGRANDAKRLRVAGRSVLVARAFEKITKMSWGRIQGAAVGGERGEQ